MSQENDADLQEAIRLSLLEVNNPEADNSHQPLPDAPLPGQPRRREPPPFFIDILSDDDDYENTDNDRYDIHPDVSRTSHRPDDELPMVTTGRGGAPDRVGYGYWPVEDDVGDQDEEESDEDDDFKRAIALSLQEARLSASSQDPEPSSTKKRQRSSSPTTPNRAAAAAAAARNSSSSTGGGRQPDTLAALLGQDRAEMERQRQERLRRREASELQGRPAATRTEKRARLSSPPAGGALPPSLSSSSSPPPPPPPSKRAQARAPVPAPAAEPAQPPKAPAHSSYGPRLSAVPFDYPIKYVKATFMNTHIVGTVKEKTQVSLEDLIDKQHLQRAVLTSYTSDPLWLVNYLPTDKEKKVVLVVHWRRDKGEEISEDWGSIVNTLYVQDFPMRASRVQTPEELGDFGSTLHNFMQAMTLPDKVLATIRGVNFSSAKVHLIPSINGSFLRDGQYRYGSARLSQVLRNNTVRRHWDMEYQTGSLGKMTPKFMNEFYDACQGLPVVPRSRYEPERYRSPMKIVYPTEETIQEGVYGEYAGRNMVCSLYSWNSPTFPRKTMHTYVCRGSLKGYMMHTKLVLARASNRSPSAPDVVPKRPTKDKMSNPIPTGPVVQEEPIPENLPTWEGWFLVGSHNFTESAWGTVVKRASGLHISVRNYELSVLCPVETAREFVDAEGLFGAMPVPYERPPRPYAPRDIPWVMDKH
ncbi:hypothetical protein DFQ26_005731 [Actinomortierella ambigua]|nr:hypothetical protein DFQ26_005731 [Actinomortierella ambigua]